MVRSGIMSALLIAGITLPVWAAPKIEFDTKEYQAGTVISGKADRVQAVFTVKNTGNELLRLKNVRPSCGCTLVKWDSLIAPGRSAKIEASVNMKDYTANSYKKYITVTSNAPNDSIERLTIDFTIQSIIEVSESFVSFSANDPVKFKVITLATKKDNLKVKKVSFVPRVGTADAFKLQGDLKYVLNKTASPRSDGCHVYKLEVYRPEISGSAPGQLVIKTNHSDEPVIIVQADLLR